MPTSGFHPEGWEGVADEPPDWSATVVARWTMPWIDWGWVAAGSVVAGVGVVGVLTGWDSGNVWIVALSAAIALWALWGAGRTAAQARGRSEWMITLDPERLTLETGHPGTQPVILERGRANWLVADEISTDWHARRIGMYDDQNREVVVFVGAMARLEWRAPRASATAGLPRELPIAVLLGSWWPHPARRATRQGTAGITLRWRDSDIAGFARRERRSRLLWSLLYVPLAALLLWAAVTELRGAFSLLAAGAASAVILWRVHLLRWRPDRT